MGVCFYMFSKVIVSNTISNLRNIGKEYHVDENSFVYAKKLTAENVAGIILNNNGTNINSQARHFIKRINNNWFTTVSGSAFCQRRQQLCSELFKDENYKLIHRVYKELNHLHKLDQIIKQQDEITIDQVHDLILNEFNVDYSMKQVWEILTHKLNYNCKNTKVIPK